MAYGAILGKSTVTQSQLNNAAPYNWLDNSDFTNLVMQAGLNGKHGTTTYMADRWIVNGGTPSYTQGVGVSFNGTIQQKLEFAPTGDVTVIVKTTNGYITSKDSPENINTQVSYFTGTTNYVLIDSNGTDTIQWVALYEGNYKDTTKIPTYHPKGYANELATCQRYYIEYSAVNKNRSFFIGYARNSSTLSTIINIGQMRLLSPTLVYEGSLKALSGTQNIQITRVSPDTYVDYLFRINFSGSNFTSSYSYLIASQAEGAKIAFVADM